MIPDPRCDGGHLTGIKDLDTKRGICTGRAASIRFSGVHALLTRGRVLGGFSSPSSGSSHALPKLPALSCLPQTHLLRRDCFVLVSCSTPNLPLCGAPLQPACRAHSRSASGPLVIRRADSHSSAFPHSRTGERGQHQAALARSSSSSFLQEPIRLSG